VQWAGASVADKVGRLQAMLAMEGADVLLVAMLDEVSTQ
jgi:hypothetical protein